MEKIIVTGGAGFIGSHIVDVLVESNFEVHVVDNLSAGKIENVNKKAILHIVDICEKEKLLEIFKDAKYAFHEAGLLQVQFSIENPIVTNLVNVGGLLNVLEACRINKVKRLIFASSAAIYGDQETLPLVETLEPKPLSPYALQKYIGEKYCELYSQIYNLETVCLRYFNVYGDRQSVNGAYPLVIAKFLELKKQNKPLQIVGDGENTRDYIHVSDIARANILAMKSEKVGKGDVLNIGSGERFSVNQIAKLIGGEIQYLPPRVEPKHIVADIKKAKELLGFEPTISLPDGILELMK